MSIKIRNLTVNPNPLIASDILPVDPSATATTVSNTVHDIINCGPSNVASGTHARTIGNANTASGNASVCLGYNNISSGLESIAIGSTNTSAGQISVTIGQANSAGGYCSKCIGYGNYAAGDISSAIGYQAVTVNYNETAIGFNVNSISLCQSGIVGFSTTTTNNTPLRMYLDGLSATQYFIVSINTVYRVRVYVTAIDATGEIATFSGAGTLLNNAATVTLVSALSMTLIESTGAMSAASVAVTADNTNKALNITVTGIASNVKWIARIDYDAVSIT